jgi:hypothetical protein
LQVPTRRDFLSIIAKAAAMAAVTPLLPGPVSIFRTPDVMEGSSMGQTEISCNHYELPFNLGIGVMPLGNKFEVVTEEDALAIIGPGSGTWNTSTHVWSHPASRDGVGCLIPWVNRTTSE